MQMSSDNQARDNHSHFDILYSVKQTVLQEMNVVLSSPGATSENKSPVGAEDVDYMHNTS